MSTSAERYLNRVVSTFCFNYVISDGCIFDKIDDINYDEENYSYNAYMSLNGSKCKVNIDTHCEHKGYDGRDNTGNNIRFSVYIIDKKKEHFAYRILYNINSKYINMPKIVDYTNKHYSKLEEICKEIIASVLNIKIFYQDFMDESQYREYNNMVYFIASSYLKYN